MYTVETGVLSQRLIKSYIDANNLQSSVFVVNKSLSDIESEDFGEKQVNCSLEVLLLVIYFFG